MSQKFSTGISETSCPCMDDSLTADAQDQDPNTQSPTPLEQQPIVARESSASNDDMDFSTPNLACKSVLMLGWTGCGKSSLCKIVRFALFINTSRTVIVRNLVVEVVVVVVVVVVVEIVVAIVVVVVVVEVEEVVNVLL